MQRGRTARDVAGLVEPPRVIKPELVPLTLPEARAVLVAAESAENSARWSDALALGLRQGEALGLLWRDVDLDRGTPMVRRALQRQKGQGLVLVEPKSRAGRRTIALPDTLLAALRNHRVAQLQHPVTAAGVYEDRGDPAPDPGRGRTGRHAAARPLADLDDHALHAVPQLAREAAARVDQALWGRA